MVSAGMKLDADSKALVKELKDAGLSDEAISAAWPSWWNDAAAASSSARAELRFSLSRKLGLSPRSLLGERVEFVWHDEARFKNLKVGDALQRGALASFGVAVGRLLLRGTQPVRSLEGIAASALRKAVLANREVVDLVGLLSACWGLGVPVVHLRVFPLRAKSMRAMIVEVEGRHAILLGRDASYPSPIAFTLAHEIGHAALGHVGSGKAIVDVGDPAFEGEDEEEREADAFGLELLTGSARPTITTNTENFSARGLAQACIAAGPQRGIEPGTLALCVGYMSQNWATANAALKHVYVERKEVWRAVNALAERELSWGELGAESAQYLRILIGADD
jgi:IrrE N-terminal-like domain